MLALVKRLSKTSQNTEDCTNNLTLGWINAICTAMPLVDGKSVSCKGGDVKGAWEGVVRMVINKRITRVCQDRYDFY